MEAKRAVVGFLGKLFAIRRPKAADCTPESADPRSGEPDPDPDTAHVPSDDRQRTDMDPAMFKLDAARWLGEGVAERRKQEEEERYDRECYPDAAVDESEK